MIDGAPEPWFENQLELNSVRNSYTMTLICEEFDKVHGGIAGIRDSIGGNLSDTLEGIPIVTRLASIKISMDSMNGRLGSIESDVGTLKSDVGTLKSDVGTLKSDVGTLKSDVGTLKSDVSKLATGMSQVLRILEGRGPEN
ncbi:hypothetical protein ACFVMC_11770 [Nocardia sp. NPDC127579]|uniref:hypothetical protein n=1 Tax=Nocardia sp. NPDC127579 TaxID=3345402 RepID=UPI0036458D62